MRSIYQNKAPETVIDKELTEFFASKFWQGYKSSFDKIDLNRPDKKFIQAVKKSIYQFAAAKNYRQLKALSAALLDDEGKLLSFTKFRQVAAAINEEFVDNWLKAEYNYAVAAGQMAATWQRIEEIKDIMPLLEYRTVGDDRVRPSHQELEGVLLPVDHWFWDEFYPPNGWNCRCDVYQRDSGKPTPEDKIPTIEIPALFKYNVGKQPIAFPEGHPYYVGLPASVKRVANKLSRGKS